MDEPIINPQKESIKLSKMSKGYQWEIKVIEEQADEKLIERLDKLNKALERGYGNNEIQRKD